VSVVHRTYARALYEAAAEKGRLESVREELSDFAAAIHDVPDLRALLRNPQLDPRLKAAALQELLGSSDEMLRNFLLLIAEKGRGAEIEPIAVEFERLAAAAEGQLEVELTTAYELSDADARAILGQIEEASGRRIEARRKVDQGLIGGFVLQAGSLRIDASVRGRLVRLRQELATTRS
jgi:F-type H+-transporting ATPase subunit delta